MFGFFRGKGGVKREVSEEYKREAERYELKNDVNNLHYSSEEARQAGFVFDIKTGFIENYIGPDIEELLIPSTIGGKEVCWIREACFKGKKIKSVYFPKTMMYIDKHAFDGCGLESVEFNEGLKGIDCYAFINNNLTKLDLPKSLNCIRIGAFSYNKLIEVRLHDPVFATDTKNKSITSVGNPFSFNPTLKYIHCTSDKYDTYGATCLFCPILKRLIVATDKITVFPEVKVIGDECFAGLNISDLEIPYGVEIIGDNFLAGTQVKKLTLANSVKQVTANTFNAENPELIGEPARQIEAVWEYGDPVRVLQPLPKTSLISS